MRILFMGTPEFAVATLDKLMGSAHEVVGVVTIPDKPMGRGLQFGQSAVKKYAAAQGLHVLQPEKLRDEAFVEAVRALQPDLAVVVAFRMLPEIVWSLPKLGTINLHASLLPQYRGAAPINWAIIRGEIQSGVTTFFINEEIDKGNLLMQAKVDIPADWDAGKLHDALMAVGADLVLQTVDGLQAGSLQAKPQLPTGDLKTAPKIHKEDCKIDWQKSAVEIQNLVRGMSPYPAAFTTINGKILKIFSTQIETSPLELNEIGDVYISDKKQNLVVKTGNGLLKINELQLEGKKRMQAHELLRGLNDEWKRFI